MEKTFYEEFERFDWLNFTKQTDGQITLINPCLFCEASQFASNKNILSMNVPR